MGTNLSCIRLPSSSRKGKIVWETRSALDKDWFPFKNDCQAYIEQLYQECLRCEMEERVSVRTHDDSGKTRRMSIDFQTMTMKLIDTRANAGNIHQIDSIRRKANGVVPRFGTFRVKGGEVLSDLDQAALAEAWRQVPRPSSLSLPESGRSVENFEVLELDGATCDDMPLEVWAPLETAQGEVLMPAEMEAADDQSLADFGSTINLEETSESMEEDSVQCKICYSAIAPTESAFKLKCEHIFHESCLTQWFESKQRCPLCGKDFGKVYGCQPLHGRMRWSTERYRLPGHPHAKESMKVEFDFPAGTYDDGREYTKRTPWCYLPCDAQGNILLALYKVAFRRRVMFGFGPRLKDGMLGATFNIHIKTSRERGMENHGFPDATYFTRSLEELRTNGVTMTDLPT